MKPVPSLADGILLLGGNRESTSISLMFDLFEPATPIEIRVDERIPTPTWLIEGKVIVGKEAIEEYYDRNILQAFAGLK